MAINWAPPEYSLRQLQYAVAVADLLSFRKAAEICHVSQPSLSAQLQQLESALGMQLFERTRRRVLLTTAGAQIIERARALLRSAGDLTEAARRIRNPFVGTLRVGVIPTVSPYLLPSVAPALRKTFPELTVLWTEERTRTVVKELEAGTLDAGLLATEAELGDLHLEVIADDPFYLAAAREHPLMQESAPLPAAEIRGEDVLLLDEGHCFRDQALAVCSRARAHELAFRATSMATLTQMTATTGAVTLLPEMALDSEARRFKLKFRKLTSPSPKRTIALAWRKSSPLADALTQISDVLRAAYPKFSATKQS